MTVTCLILGVNLGGNVLTWTHPLVISSLVLFLLAGTTLYFVERKAELPILPLKLLFTAPNGNLIWSNFLGSLVTNTILFNVPLYLQAVRQTSPTTSGLFLMSPLVVVSVTALITGTYITITRKMKPPIVIGSFFLLCGGISVACLSSTTPIWVVPLLIPFGAVGQGFFFPASTISLLAINPQNEQAVVSTTLGLLRSLGSIMGVAISSWILQNALLIYLDRYVTAPDAETKARIIRTVRESIRSIKNLDPLHKTQVINAYAQSLRVTFVVAIVVGGLCICLLWPVRLPKLQRQEDMDKRDAGVFVAAEEEGDTSGDEEIEDDEDSEHALLVTPTQSITRTRTASTSRSHMSRMSIQDRMRRGSFETAF